MRFTKMHGAGNDYLYVDGRVQERNWPALSAAMSDRHTGVGSDGLIVLMPSDAADLRMAMFNADGSEGKMCGNGIRCLVAFAMDRGMVPKDRERVHVETPPACGGSSRCGTTAGSARPSSAWASPF